jgi:hypothetical protein
VTQAEGFSKARLFEILDGLRDETKPLLAAARAALAKDKGEAALEPWNTGYFMAGACGTCEKLGVFAEQHYRTGARCPCAKADAGSSTRSSSREAPWPP